MPRAGLTRDRVVDEAADLADEIGLDQLTLVTLASRLGVRQPSLYKHIDSLSGLHRSIAMQSKTQLADALGRAAVGRSGRDAIIAMSRAYRSWAVEHPARYRAAQLMPEKGDPEHEAATAAPIQIIVDVLAAYELEGDDAIDAVRAFRATLHGFVALETEGSFQLSADVERSFDRMIRGFATALSTWTEPDAG